MIADFEYERRTLDVAQRVLDDIPECSAAEYRLRFIDGVPVLILVFDLPQTRMSSACGIRLRARSKSNPMGDGGDLEGDRLRRHIRDSIEQYLAKNGIKITVAGAFAS